MFFRCETRTIFTALLPVFDAAGYAVVNATPGCRLTIFSMTELAAATVDTSASTNAMYRSARTKG